MQIKCEDQSRIVLKPETPEESFELGILAALLDGNKRFRSDARRATIDVSEPPTEISLHNVALNYVITLHHVTGHCSIAKNGDLWAVYAGHGNFHNKNLERAIEMAWETLNA